MPKEDTQFKPGQSGNPKGKKKGTLHRKTLAKMYLELACDIVPFPEEVQKVIDHVNSELGKTMSNQEALMICAVIHAAKGSSKHLEILLDSAHGKLSQEVINTIRTIEDELDDIPDEEVEGIE